VSAGIAIGLFQGSVVTRFGIPSFVVTLAGLIGWQGVLLWVLGDTGTVNITDPTIVDLAGTFYSGATAWILAGVVVAAFAAATLNARRRRLAAGLEAAAPVVVGARIGAVAVVTFGVVAVLTQDRGVPLALLILLGFVVFFDYIVRRTRFGRHILAVGGNAEAARRAGIQVNWIRISVFAIASAMAACGGILAASRLLAVNQSSGGSDLLLLAIAGPVIAGTSLFGGRGTVWSALLGGLIIGSISNGMDLLALSSSVKFMVTGAVLLAAVVIDAAARQRRQRAGRV
jgi:D-xylose transport system permease protein